MQTTEKMQATGKDVGKPNVTPLNNQAVEGFGTYNIQPNTIQPTIQPSNLRKPQAVRDILQDEQYMGTYIAGKTYQVTLNASTAPGNDRHTDVCSAEKNNSTGQRIKGDNTKKHPSNEQRTKKYHTPKSEWIKIPDKHPAIISKDVFEQVQLIRAISRKNMSHRDYLLSGKTSCGCCGYALSYNAATAIHTYRCTKTHANPAAACHKMKVSSDELESPAMAIIKKQAEVVLGSELTSLDDLSDFRKASVSDDLSGYRKTSVGILSVDIPGNSTRLIAGAGHISDYEKQINQLSKERQSCYEQFVGGEIGRDTFQTLKAGYTLQIDMLNNQLSILKQSRRQAEQSKDASNKAEALARNALSETATSKDIVNALIEKVLVFPDNHVEIRWKFANFADGCNFIRM